MGIPAAFRWLSTKYPKIVSPVAEDLPKKMEDGTVIPVDATRPNPNGEEFDNLYLDMNGIVHPCSHPEDRPAPRDEEEMMQEIFKYTDRVVNMVRPRKLLMIAVDGVAPRAKMNQQRSRRFRSAQEAGEKEKEKQDMLKLLRSQNGGAPLPDEVANAKAFDSNSITPGTPFMDMLAASLRYWCAYKLNTDPAWAKMKVIISDATVPGEGEHKIMEFVRSQRASPDHDPNTRHVIYGLDADLIMLGLATHEPHFRVLREDVFMQSSKVKVCHLCGQKGHEVRNCTGAAREKQKQDDGGNDKEADVPLKPFIWLHVAIFREYLAVELNVPGLPFRFDLERAIDDWVFMCFFVGNDFLPHLPALEIRENAIETLMAIWRDNLPSMGGYVTKDGNLNLDRAQLLLHGLAKQEDAIFRRRKDTEDRKDFHAKRRRLEGGGQRRDQTAAPAQLPQEMAKVVTHDMIMNRGAAAVQDANLANKSAASVIRDRLQAMKGNDGGGGGSPPTADAAKNGASGVDVAVTSQGSPSAATPTTIPTGPGKRKALQFEADNAPGAPDGKAAAVANSQDEEELVDEVRLWEDGYADRYYEKKFHVDRADIAFRHNVARSYVEGLAWVLRYYFQGCASWEWFYPYHYAPFAQDFVDIGTIKIKFDKGRISRPFEQLMSVLPAASRHALPEPFHELMLAEDSEIIDFYPEEFKVDLNGKKFAWQGVALLPFIEMPRLLGAMEKKYPLLNAEDAARNGFGRDVLLFSELNHELYDDVATRFYSKKRADEPRHRLNPKLSQGLAGRVVKLDDYVPHGPLPYPLEREREDMPSLDYDRSIRVEYQFPPMSHQHKSLLLNRAKPPNPVLTRSDIEVLKGKIGRAGRSYGGAPLDNNGHRGPINYAPGDHRFDDRGGRSNGPRRGGGGGGGGGRYSNPPYNNRPPPPPSSYYGQGPPGVQSYGGAGLPLPPPPPAYFNGYPPPASYAPPPQQYQQGYGGPGGRHGYGGRGDQGERDNGGSSSYRGQGQGQGQGQGRGGGQLRSGPNRAPGNWMDHNF